MKTVYNYKSRNPKDNPVFFGDPIGLQRYDRLKYKKFYDLAVKMEKLIWSPDEVSLLKDKGDYMALSDTEKFIFDQNIFWQTSTDAMLSRSIDQLLPYVTNTELEKAMKVWSYFESNIHSFSYSHIFKSIHGNETPIWDAIEDDEEIQRRAAEAKAEWDALMNLDEEEDKRKHIFRSIVAFNVVEGLSFHISFACSFAFAYQGKMEGNAKIIALIARDELLHHALTTEILKVMRDNPDEGFQDVYDEKFIRDAYELALKQENRWIEFLFQKGDILGFTKQQMLDFADHRAYYMLNLLKIETPGRKIKENPIGRMYNQFINKSAVQVAPQETEIESYQIASTDAQVDFDALKDFL